MPDLMPAIFFGHGNPMNAISENVFTDGWSAIGRGLPRPKAILSVSAHWYRTGCAVTANPVPHTIHDFGGFPRELFEFEYRAPGSPELALKVKDLLAPEVVELDEGWGLDHGTWSVLCHVFKDADIPVVQLAVDKTQPPAFHYEMGRRLSALREEGILVIGSGNIVHNLSMYSWDARSPFAFEWAERFEKQARELLTARDDARLIAYERLGNDAKLSIPTPDHFLPLLYVLGLGRNDDSVSYPVEGIEGGSLSMLTVKIG
jgi:4,5-DOPA dioxygenase extradiol